MVGRYYYRQGTQEFGPVTGDELQRLAQQGVLRSTDEIRREDDLAWIPAADLAALFPPPAVEPPPLPRYDTIEPLTGAVPGAPPIGPYPALARRRELPTGQAVAAMVLGIVAVVIPGVGLITGLIALILGFSARGKAKRGLAGGKGMATAGIVTGIAGILISVAVCGGAILVPSFMNAFIKTQRVMHEAHMELIAKACERYAAQHDGRLPATLGALVQAGLIEPEGVVLAATVPPPAGASPAEQAAWVEANNTYLFAAAGRKLSELAPSDVLLCQPIAEWGSKLVIVRLVNGQTEVISAEQLDRRLARQGDWHQE